MTKRKRRRKTKVTPLEFVRVWETSQCLDDVANKLGLPKQLVSSRAMRFRKAGVKLKRINKWQNPHGNKKIFVNELNALIRQIDAQGQNPHA